MRPDRWTSFFWPFIEAGSGTLGPLRKYLGIAIVITMAGGCGRHPTQTKMSAEPRKRGYTGESLPDPRFTPGDTLKVSKEDICTPGYTRKIRDVPAALKAHVYQMYGRSRESGVCCELDHLIPLELGGSNRPTNLWPERFDLEWNARVKDRIEGRLHKLVCSGELDLATAQQEIARNWIEAYQKYEAPGGRRRAR